MTLIGTMPLCVRHCRFSPKKLIERPMSTSLLPAFSHCALMTAPEDEAGFVIFDVPEIHHFPATTPSQADLFGCLPV